LFLDVLSKNFLSRSRRHPTTHLKMQVHVPEELVFQPRLGMYCCEATFGKLRFWLPVIDPEDDDVIMAKDACFVIRSVLTLPAAVLSRAL
jgi:hypothetical protein